MPLYPHKYDGPFEVYLVITLVVFLLCWLYNGHRLGKFQKKKYTAPRASIEKAHQKKWLTLVLCLVLGILIGLGFRFL